MARGVYFSLLLLSVATNKMEGGGGLVSSVQNTPVLALPSLLSTQHSGKLNCGSVLTRTDTHARKFSVHSHLEVRAFLGGSNKGVVYGRYSCCGFLCFFLPVGKISVSRLVRDIQLSQKRRRMGYDCAVRVCTGKSHSSHSPGCTSGLVSSCCSPSPVCRSRQATECLGQRMHRPIVSAPVVCEKLANEREKERVRQRERV